MIYRYEEYSELLRQHFLEEDWQELSRYTDFLANFCREKDYDVEEYPTKDEEKITLGGFVGTYRFNSKNEMVIRCKSEKLTDEEFFAMIADIAHWTGMLGPPFLRALLNICSPVRGEHEIALAYSDLLIKCTENAGSEYISPLIEKKKYISPIPLGKILIVQTISHFSQGQFSFVSQRSRVNIESLLRLFLVRFHGEMAQALKRLEACLETENEKPLIQPLRAISQNLNYHTSFIMSDLNRNVLDKTYETDFSTSDTLQELWKQASTSPSLRDIILLWEAFMGKRVLLSRISEILRGGYMLKPLSKLYEIWCLKAVLDVLEDLFGNYEVPERLPGRFTFDGTWNGWKVEVLYNETPLESRVVKKLQERGLGVAAGKKPDLTITFSDQKNRKITVVTDVKYKLASGIYDDDIGRFFWYLVDYGSLSGKGDLGGILLYVPTSDKVYDFVSREEPKMTIHLVGIKPHADKESKERLRKIFCELLE